MKIVINKCFGGFGISKDFFNHYKIPIVETGYGFHPQDEWTKNERTDIRLIEYIEKYGSKRASDEYASLCVEEIPNGAKYQIKEYNGVEYIETR